MGKWLVVCSLEQRCGGLASNGYPWPVRVRGQYFVYKSRGSISARSKETIKHNFSFLSRCDYCQTGLAAKATPATSQLWIMPYSALRIDVQATPISLILSENTDILFQHCKAPMSLQP